MSMILIPLWVLLILLCGAVLCPVLMVLLWYATRTSFLEEKAAKLEALAFGAVLDLKEKNDLPWSLRRKWQ